MSGPGLFCRRRSNVALPVSILSAVDERVRPASARFPVGSPDEALDGGKTKALLEGDTSLEVWHPCFPSFLSNAIDPKASERFKRFAVFLFRVVVESEAP